MRRDDDSSDSPSSLSAFDRIWGTRADNTNSGSSSRLSFDSSFSTSGAISTSTRSSSTQNDSKPSNLSQNQIIKSNTMFGPFGVEVWWPSHSPAGLALSSRYSPLALDYLPQPVPRDATSDMDTSIFTFQDAFEDLLAVSSGQPLPNITTRYEQRKLLRSMFPDGEPTAWWLRRLKSQGLLEMPKPEHFLQQAGSNWDQFHQELNRRAGNVWRAANGEDYKDSRDPYQEQDEEEDNFSKNSRQWSLSFPRRREPDDFDEFFNSFRSSFPEPQSSWDTFVKSFHDEPSDKTLKEQPDKNQEVVKDEYVDRFGYLHKKVTVKTIDENGNQIGSQTHYTVRPADKQPAESQEVVDDDKSGIRASGKAETKTGWFWK